MKSVLIPSFTLLFAFSMLITAVLLYDLDSDFPDETESNGTKWSEMESGEAVNDVDEWTRDFNDSNSQSLNVTLT
ncbi:hypothetical protein ACH3XW_0860 [Acanthocheilonema viteae]